MNTSGYGGTLLKKSITVETSAPVQPNITLDISGNVEKFADVSPNKVVLRGNAGESVTATVTVIPDAKYPFKVLETTTKNGTDIKAKTDEKKENDITTYIVTVENLKKDPGRYYDVVTLKTDSSIKPELQVSVYGQILEAPPQKTP